MSLLPECFACIIRVQQKCKRMPVGEEEELATEQIFSLLLEPDNTYKLLWTLLNLL